MPVRSMASPAARPEMCPAKPAGSASASVPVASWNVIVWPDATVDWKSRMPPSPIEPEPVPLTPSSTKSVPPPVAASVPVLSMVLPVSSVSISPLTLASTVPPFSSARCPSPLPMVPAPAIVLSGVENEDGARTCHQAVVGVLGDRSAREGHVAAAGEAHRLGDHLIAVPAGIVAVDLERGAGGDLNAGIRARARVVDTVPSVERAAVGRFQQPRVVDGVAGVERERAAGGVDRAAGIVLQRQRAVARPDGAGADKVLLSFPAPGRRKPRQARR